MTKQTSDLNLTENTDDLDDFRVPEVPKRPRIEMLKERATQLGITYSPNIGEETLSRKIQAHLEGQNAEEKIQEKEQEVEQPSTNLTVDQKRALKRKEAMKLVRVVVHPMDPLRSQLEGEIITGGNSVVGTVSKYVPFNNENGYYIPQILFNILKDRKYLAHYTVTDSKGNEINRHRLAPAFNIVTLPDLSEKELARLAADQRARSGRADYED